MKKDFFIIDDIETRDPVFQTFSLIGPLFSALFLEDISIGICDTETLLMHQVGRNFDLQIRPGYTVSRGDGMYEAIHSKAAFQDLIPQEVFGVSIMSTAIPIINNRGVVLGAIAVGTSLENYEKIYDIASKLSTSITEFTSTISGLNNSSTQYQKTMGDISTNAQNVLSSLKDIEKVSKAVQEVTESTKILGINASIEASRAGDAGRGFKVVAQEIGRLADNSKDHIDTIRDTVSTIDQLIKELDHSINRVGEDTNEQNAVLEELFASIKGIAEFTGSLSDVAKDAMKVESKP